VARYSNCTRAAEELNLTPGAVSKQLQSLEDTLGVQLFIRGQHSLMLTEAGQTYLDLVRPAIHQLAEASAKAVKNQLHQTELHLSVQPAFADRWLLPRFSQFADANPDLKIHIHASVMRDEELLPSHDMFVRCCMAGSLGSWQGCLTDYICGNQYIIVASPALLQQGPPIRDPVDLTRFQLHGHSWIAAGWNQVLESLGVEFREPSHFILWDFFTLVIRVALEGHGLSLVPKCFVTENLANNTLVQVLGYSHYFPCGNYLVFAKGRKDDVAISRFRNWLRSKQYEGEDPAPEAGGNGLARQVLKS